MTDKDQTDRLFEELGSALGEGSVARFDDESENKLGPCWAVALDDEHAVEIAEDTASQSLVFAVDLGPLNRTPTERFFEILLRYNHLAESTGGVYMALGPDLGLALMYKHPVADLDTQRLFNLIRGLAEKRAVWTEIIALPEDRNIEAEIQNLPPNGIMV